MMRLLHCKQVTIGRRSSCLLPHGMAGMVEKMVM